MQSGGADESSIVVPEADPPVRDQRPAAEPSWFRAELHSVVDAEASQRHR